MNRPLRVKCRKVIYEGFKVAAIAAFPLEKYGVLLGKRSGRRVWIKDIWIPDNQEKWADEHTLLADAVRTPSWRQEAEAIADSEGLQVVGDIHSHCWRVRKVHERGREPSETDWRNSPVPWVIGICTVSKSPTEVWSSVAFWDSFPMAEVELI
jgi:proteasome lid subunit RPN8/RPN11